MQYILEIKSQHSVGGSKNGGFGGPDRYVAVQIVPDGVAPLASLQAHVAKQRGIKIKHFGEGYSKSNGPKSALGQAIAAAKAYIAEQTVGTPA